jgi:hypothetical protein
MVFPMVIAIVFSLLSSSSSLRIIRRPPTPMQAPELQLGQHRGRQLEL